MEENKPLFSLTIDNVSKEHLFVIARWARFLGIVILVLMGIAILATLYTATLTVDVPPGFENELRSQAQRTLRTSAIIGSLVILGVTIPPTIFLLQFSGRIKIALLSENQELLNDSLKQLKRYFRYIGILLIILLAFYALAFLVALGTGGQFGS